MPNRSVSLSRRSIMGTALSVTLAVTLSVAVAVGAAVSLTGCNGLDANSKPVVTINDSVVVTQGEYNKLFDQLVKQANLDPRQLVSAPRDSQEGQLKEQIKQYALNKLIFSAMVKDAAKKAGVTVTDDELKAFRAEQLEAIGGEEALNVVLKERDITEDAFNDTLKEQLLTQKFIDKELAPKQYGENDAQAFYNSHKELFFKPPGVKASHILLKVIPGEVKAEVLKKNPNATTDELDKTLADLKAKKKAEAEKILADVKAHPEQFEALAKKHSEDKLSQIKGGKLDTLYKPSTDPAFWAAATSNKPGTLVPTVVESSFGYHIIKVDSLEQPGQQPFSAVKEDILRVLQQQQRQQSLMKWVTEQRKDIHYKWAEGYAPEGDADQAAAGTDDVNGNLMDGGAMAGTPNKKG